MLLSLEVRTQPHRLSLRLGLRMNILRRLSNETRQIVQESHEIIVGEYRLPEAKPGTAMYFDFPRQIQARRISFRLLGDIAAFIDDPSEQDDYYDSKISPLASGLSLSSRIKLYYYADSYELGKWASLSAV